MDRIENAGTDEQLCLADDRTLNGCKW